MSFQDYAETQVLTHLFRTASWTKPSALYVALLTAAPADSASGSTVTEAAYTSYARVQVNPSDSNWDLSSGTASNHSTITFPTATGSSATVTHFAICDASTSGNAYCTGALTVTKTITSGDTPQFAAGSLTFSLD